MSHSDPGPGPAPSSPSPMNNMSVPPVSTLPKAVQQLLLDTPATPATPYASLEVLIYALVRSGILVACGVGLAVPAFMIDGPALYAVIGALVSGGTAAWSIWQKIQAARKDFAGSVQSAKTGLPVQVR